MKKIFGSPLAAAADAHQFLIDFFVFVIDRDIALRLRARCTG